MVSFGPCQDKPSTPTSTSAPIGSGADIDLSRMVFAAKSNVQEAAVVFVKDIKNPRPGPSLYRVNHFPLVKLFNGSASTNSKCVRWRIQMGFHAFAAGK